MRDNQWGDPASDGEGNPGPGREGKGGVNPEPLKGWEGVTQDLKEGNGR